MSARLSEVFGRSSTVLEHRSVDLEDYFVLHLSLQLSKIVRSNGSKRVLKAPLFYETSWFCFTQDDSPTSAGWRMGDSNYLHQ